MHKTLLTPALAAYAAGKAIAPLWVAPNGRAFYPIAGGSEEPPKDGGDGGGDGAPKTFEAITSQEDLDRIVGQRLAREKAKYSDYDDLKAAKSEYDKLLEESKTEQQKAIDAARTEGESTERQRSNARLIAAEARAFAAEAGAHNSAVAVRALDLSGVKIADDGTVDQAALKAAVDALKTSDPYLFNDGRARPKPDHSQGGGGGSDDKPSVSRGQELYDLHRGKKKAS